MICVGNEGTVLRLQQDFARTCRNYVKRQHVNMSTRSKAKITYKRLQEMELSLFAKIRKNVVHKADHSVDTAVMEPVDHGLVAEVQQLDAALDAMVERVKRRREEVPAALQAAVQKRTKMMKQTPSDALKKSDIDPAKQQQQKQLTKILYHLQQTFEQISEKSRSAAIELTLLRSTSEPTIRAIENRAQKPVSATELAIAKVHGAVSTGPRSNGAPAQPPRALSPSVKEN